MLRQQKAVEKRNIILSISILQWYTRTDISCLGHFGSCCVPQTYAMQTAGLLECDIRRACIHVYITVYVCAGNDDAIIVELFA